MNNESGLSVSEVDQIWRVLVEEIDVRDDPRELASFTYHQLRRRCGEYRLSSSLGFGGKFKIAGDGRWHVDQYPEDETPQTRAAICQANARLAQLQEKRNETHP